MHTCTHAPECARRPVAARRLMITVSGFLLTLAAIGCEVDDGRLRPGPDRRDTAATPGANHPQAAGSVTDGRRTDAGRPQTPPVFEEAFEQAAVEAVPSAPPATYSEADQLYRQRLYAEAADAFASVLSAHPGNNSAKYMLGLSAWKSGENERAERALRELLEDEPTHRKARINLARVLLEDDRSEEARQEAEEAIRLGDTDADAHRVAGRAYQQLGLAEKAEAAYTAALAIDPNDAWSWNNLGLLRIEAGRYAEAVEPLETAVRLRSGVALFHNNLGAALERSGDLAAAALAYRAAVDQAADHVRAAASLARVESNLAQIGPRPETPTAIHAPEAGGATTAAQPPSDAQASAGGENR